MSSELAQFYSRTRDARKVIVVDLGFLGDTVHLVPALWGLRQGYPRSELHVVTTPVGCEVLRLADCADHAWSIEMYRHRRKLGEQVSVLRALRRERFDVAYNFSGADRTIFVTALTGARWRVAYQGARDHVWNRWLIGAWVPPSDVKVPVYERRRAVLAACGLDPGPVRFDLRAPETERDWARMAIPENAIHFSICASTPMKEWPVEQWARLAAKLAAAGFRMVATGSDRERERVRLESFSKAARNVGVHTQAGLSLVRLAAVLERCLLHVGGDSGATQLAMGLNRPTVSLFREYPAIYEWLPQGPLHRSLRAPCPCIDLKEPPCRDQAHAQCLAGISPESVAELVLDQVGKAGSVAARK